MIYDLTVTLRHLDTGMYVREHVDRPVRLVGRGVEPLLVDVRDALAPGPGVEAAHATMISVRAKVV